MTAADKLDKKFRQMTEEPVEALVCRMAVPTIISMMITSFYNMADTFFVSSIGTSATAAVGVVFSLMAVIQAVGFFFGQGSGNTMARLLGEKKHEEASRIAATGFFSALACGCLIAVAGLSFMSGLSRALGATETIVPYANDYMRWILLGAPYMTASLVLNNQLRLQGNAFYAMLGLTSGAFLNLALDPLFIFTFGMGISGAALATVISQLVSFCILLAGCNRAGTVPIKLKNFSPSLRRYRSIFGGGLPSFFRQALASTAAICLNQAAGGFGDAAIAAMAVVNRVSNFASSALFGFGQGFQPVCAYNYGARRYDRVKKAYWFCVKTATIVLSALAIAGFIKAGSIIAAFCKTDLLAQKIGTGALRFQCLTVPFIPVIVLSNMMLQVMGKAFKASLLALARQGLFFLPFIILLPPILGIRGLQASQPLADILSFTLALPLALSVFIGWKKDPPVPQTGRPPIISAADDDSASF